jgi:hypothetical protein
MDKKGNSVATKQKKNKLNIQNDVNKSDFEVQITSDIKMTAMKIKDKKYSLKFEETK